MANFIKDASKNYGVVQKRKKIDAEFQRRINLAETPAQKKKRSKPGFLEKTYCWLSCVATKTSRLAAGVPWKSPSLLGKNVLKAYG